MSIANADQPVADDTPQMQHLASLQPDDAAARPAIRPPALAAIGDDSRRTSGFIGAETGMTRSRRTQNSLYASEERFRSLVETSLFGVCIERAGRPLFVNQAFADIFGYASSDELMALGTLDVLYPLGEPQRLAQACKHLPGGRSPSQHEIRGIRKDGSLIWLHAHSRIVPWDDGTALQSTLIDVTLRKRYEDHLQHQATFDAVTDLPNRSLALDRLVSAIEAARRRASCVYVLFIDVDHFKKINDTLGHTAGDRLLRQLAQRLKASVRQMDTVARLGGDEFVVILGDVRLPDDAAAVAGKIAEACSRPFLLDGQETFVTVSVGAAAFPEDGDDAEDLLRSADAAMYVGKENGRGQVHFFTPELRQRSHDRLRREVALRHALERGELTLHYQPLIEIRTGTVVGAEALLRWCDPEHGNTGSDEFVRLAEDTGLIVPIGEWVLATGCRDLRRWIDAGHDHLGLCVNISARQFRGSLPAAIRSSLDAYRLDPQVLTLEITEGVLTEDPGEFKAMMDRLVADGIRLAVDDFGTGYSSLSYLSRVPLDTLKIDRSYTGGVLGDATRSTLVDALIILAHRLHLRVVAEGVETADQLDFLRIRGCDLAQGYFFSAPLPADNFLQLLDERRTVAAVG